MPCSFFSFVLFGQSFSRDHVNFFFSSETKNKLTSEISALKTDLDLYRSEMGIERQTHQREEKALRAQVIEAEEQRKAAVQDTLKKVEAMKKECDGILSSFVFCSFFFTSCSFLPDFPLLSCSALQKDKQVLLTDIKDMNISV
jgi:hypothetical protein